MKESNQTNSKNSEIYGVAFWWLCYFCVLSLCEKFIYNKASLLKEQDYTPSIKFYTENGILIKQHIFIDGVTYHKLNSDLFFILTGLIGSLLIVFYSYLKNRKHKSEILNK